MMNREMQEPNDFDFKLEDDEMGDNINRRRPVTSPARRELPPFTSMAVEMFTDAEACHVTFPKKSKYEHKGLLIGTAIFLNANFFEGGQDDIGSADQGMDMLGE
jgi:hypothetical protein